MYEYLPRVFDVNMLPILQERIPWRTVTWGPTNRPLPRLVSQMDISTLIDLVPELVEAISLIQSKYGNISGVWGNKYDNGSHWCPHHRDSYDCIVATLSFGADRQFLIKDKVGKETSFTLSNGDIFVFDQAFNKDHTHSIPKITPKSVADRVGPRISLVFFCSGKGG